MTNSILKVSHYNVYMTIKIQNRGLLLAFVGICLFIISEWTAFSDELLWLF